MYLKRKIFKNKFVGIDASSENLTPVINEKKKMCKRKLDKWTVLAIRLRLSVATEPNIHVVFKETKKNRIILLM